MSELQVRVLGALLVHRQGREVEVASRRQRALLAALAVSGRPVSVAELVDAVWEDDPPERAATTLQTYVSRLRGALDADAVVHGPAGYALGTDATTDVALARSLAAELGQARGNDERRCDLARRALDLWRGPSLGELADRGWFRPAATELDELRRSLVDEAGDALVATGRAGQALPLLEPQLADTPLREPTQVLLVRALHASGRTIDALRAADRYRRRLRDETGLDPGAELLAAEQDVLSGAPPPAPASGATSPSVGSLPRATELVGRTDELAELREVVERSSLVTVVGIGGVGKTRLVAELVAGSSDAHRVVVDLTPVDAAGVATAVGAAVGYRAGRADVDAIAELLRGRRATVVLDGAEHVLDEVRDLVRAVRRGAADARVVVTSRARLDLPEERLLHLGPLPTAGDRPDAVQLFSDRFRRARPHEEIDADDPALAELCARLDGIPLALELAASRAAALGIPVLTERLDDAVDLLVGGAGRRTALGDVVAFSVDLLDEAAQDVLAALSTFHADIDVDGAEAVAGPLVAEPVASVLGRLVDASLLSVRAPGRWTMLEMVRRVAGRRLEESGGRQVVAGAHARWVGRRLAAIAGTAAGAAEAETVPLLDGIRHEVGPAVRWSLEHRDADAAASIAAALAGPMLYRPDAELLDTVRRIGASTAIAGTEVEAAALASAARAAFLLGDLDDVDAPAERALALDPKPAVRHRAHHAKGVVRLYGGRFEEAVTCFDAALADARAPVERLDALGGLMLANAYLGRLDAAGEQVEEHHALADAIGSDTYRAFAHYGRAEVLFQRGDVDGAISQLVSASDRAWRVGATFVWGIASTVLGRLLVRERPAAEAARHLPLLLERWRRTATWPQLWTTLRSVAELLAGQQRADVALLVLEAAARDPAAPAHGADERARERALRDELVARLGAGAAAGIRSAAASLDRVAVLERATSALQASTD